MQTQTAACTTEQVMPSAPSLRILPSVVRDDCPSALAHIYQPEINMAIWQRELAPAVNRYAAQLLTESPHWQVRFSARPASVAKLLEDDLPKLNGRQAFIDDVGLLVDMFSCLFDLPHIGLRMAVLREAMCPKFHVDRVPCRLLCTYVGEGTLWHPFEQVDYLGNAAVRPKAGTTHWQLGANEAALLKGEAWEGNEDRGLVHCSPPASNNAPRLVLTLDFA